jgi:hypothetical protein
MNSRARPEFSLVLGGPLYHTFRRAHLSGDALELVRRRILVIACVAWLPMLLLSALSGQATGDAIAIPFLRDVEVHVRFLIALPILIGAERYVHLVVRPIVREFVTRDLVTSEDTSRFDQVLDSAARLRDSVIAEIVLLVLVYTLGVWAARQQLPLDTAGWYGTPDGAGVQLTAAGYWCFFVSVPIFQFLLLRWYLRFLIWLWLLWKVSKLNLRLVPTHPDRTAGLGFLSSSTNACMPILLAQGALLSGLIASRILHAGQDLMSFKVQVAGFVAVFVVLALIPLTVFTAQLSRAKRRGLDEFGRLASRYASAFEAKWLHGGATADGELLGSGDVQSLADTGSSYAVVDEMRILPFGMKDVVRLAVVMLVPLLPLLLTIFSPEEIVTHLLKVLF